jgi:chromosome segregation ATPase
MLMQEDISVLSGRLTVLEDEFRDIKNLIPEHLPIQLYNLQLQMRDILDALEGDARSEGEEFRRLVPATERYLKKHLLNMIIRMCIDIQHQIRNQFRSEVQVGAQVQIPPAFSELYSRISETDDQIHQKATDIEAQMEQTAILLDLAKEIPEDIVDIQETLVMQKKELSELSLEVTKLSCDLMLKQSKAAILERSHPNDSEASTGSRSRNYRSNAEKVRTLRQLWKDARREAVEATFQCESRIAEIEGKISFAKVVMTDATKREKNAEERINFMIERLEKRREETTEIEDRYEPWNLEIGKHEGVIGICDKDRDDIESLKNGELLDLDRLTSGV